MIVHNVEVGRAIVTPWHPSRSDAWRVQYYCWNLAAGYLPNRLVVVMIGGAWRVHAHFPSVGRCPTHRGLFFALFSAPCGLDSRASAVLGALSGCVPDAVSWVPDAVSWSAGCGFMECRVRFQVPGAVPPARGSARCSMPFWAGIRRHRSNLRRGTFSGSGTTDHQKL